MKKLFREALERIRYFLTPLTDPVGRWLRPVTRAAQRLRDRISGLIGKWLDGVGKRLHAVMRSLWHVLPEPFRARMVHALHAVRDVIWPQRLICLTCAEQSGGRLLCPECAAKLAAARNAHPRENIHSAYAYRFPAKQLVVALKFDCLIPAAEVLGEGMADEACGMSLPEDTVLTWVPMPAHRRRTRGIDHSRVLCEQLSERLGLPMRPLLVRARKTAEQKNLNKEQRQTNVRAAFMCEEKLDCPVLVIDDVCTTGATLQACMTALADAGATAVYGLSATMLL